MVLIASWRDGENRVDRSFPNPLTLDLLDRWMHELIHSALTERRTCECSLHACEVCPGSVGLRRCWTEDRRSNHQSIVREARDNCLHLCYNTLAQLTVSSIELTPQFELSKWRSAYEEEASELSRPRLGLPE
jgi:hypothetical protein